MTTVKVPMGIPNGRQREVMTATTKYIAFGGARGGGKSWMVREKAKRLALNYPGITILIVRRSYPELVGNHIKFLRAELLQVAKYNDKDKEFRFINGSTINFRYCNNDKDLDNFQGQQYDIIFLDEATQLSEWQMQTITACLRGVNAFPKRVYFTCNPGGQGHGYIKRLFIDKQYKDSENPEDYYFVQSLVTDNKALMAAQPDYIKQLEALPPKLREAWLYGNWDIFEGQFFEDFIIKPDARTCAEHGLTVDEAIQQRRYTHVIPAFEIPPTWNIYRSFDWGYAKPFSCAWWAVDEKGCIYRILELYGCMETPNEGVKWFPDKVFDEIHRIETEHRWLKGKFIRGVADPAIWDAEHGESVAEVAEKHYIYFEKGDNKRIPGWLQLHYRFAFDSYGYPMIYIFENCKGFIRTIPLLQYSQTHIEDLDTSQEDHIADETRYFLMSRPITAKQPEDDKKNKKDDIFSFLDIPESDIMPPTRKPTMEVYIT